MAYISQTQDEEEEKKKAGQAIGGEAPTSNTPGQSGSMPGGAQPYTQTGFASAKNILEKNKDAANQYDVTQPFQQDLEQGKSQLEGSFGKLKSSIGQQVQSQKATDQDLADAIAQGSQSGSFQKILGALKPNQVTGKLDPVQNKYSATDVASLNTAPGLQAAIANQAQQKGVQNYSQGMGALDATIFQRQPQYRSKVHDLSKQYENYDKQNKDYQAQAASEIEKSNKELADAAAAIRSRLESQSGNIQTNADLSREGGEAYKRLVANSRAATSKAAKQRDDLMQRVASSISDPTARQVFLARAGEGGANQLKLGDFYQENVGSKYDYTPEAAGQFNNIMALLGKNDRVQAGGSFNSSLNTTGIENYLKNIANESEASVNRDKETAARKAQDKKDQEDLQKAQKMAGKAVGKMKIGR